MVRTDIERSSKLGSHGIKNFLSVESTAKYMCSSYHTGKKLVSTLTRSNSSIFSLLKDVVHTPDMQHYLIKLCIEYTNTLYCQQMTAVDCSDQPIDETATGLEPTTT